MRRFYALAAVLILAIGLAWSTPASAQSGGSTTTTTAPAGAASSAITLTQGRQVSLAIVSYSVATGIQAGEANQPAAPGAGP